TFDGAFGEQGAEGGIVQGREVGEARRAQALAGVEGALVGDSGELVPRADGQAVVAAIDAVAERRAELLRDRPGVLDGQVGDAAPRIEPEGGGKGVGRADVEAGLAGAAVLP